MADNRYNVDEILREVREKRAKEAGDRPQAGVSTTTAARAEDLLTELEDARPKHTYAEPAPTEVKQNITEEKPQIRETVIPSAPQPAVQEREIPEPVEFSAEPEPDSQPVSEKHTPRPAPRQWDAAATHEECQPIFAELDRRSRHLTITFIINLLALGCVVYLALASTFHLMLPDLLAGNASYRAWGMVGLVAISAIACGGTLGNGLISLFTARRSNDAYVTLTVFACLLQGSFMAALPELMEDYKDNLYLPLAAGILLFHTLGRMIKTNRQRDNCQAVIHQPPVECRLLMPGEPITDWAGGLPEGAGNVLCLSPAASSEMIGDELEQPGHTETLAGVIAPITAGASLIMAVIAYFLGGNLYNSACIFTASLCIASPFAASLGSHLPLSRTNGGLHRWKAAMLGEDIVERLSDADAVLLRCSDLFPSGSVTLHGIKTFDKKPIDEAIVNAASVLCSVDSTLSAVFRGMIGTRDILKPVENITSEEGRGLSAWVDGGRVLIGNRELLQQHGVAVPPIEIEQKLEDGKKILYLSNFGSLSAAFVISYRADRQVIRQLNALENSGVAILLHTTDPNITPALVSEVYDVSEDCIHPVPAKLHAEAEQVLCASEQTRAGMTSSSFAGSLHCLLSAQRCHTTVKTVSVLLILEVLIGFALITFLAYTGAMASLSWLAIGAYQMIWFLLILINSFFRK